MLTSISSSFSSSSSEGSMHMDIFSLCSGLCFIATSASSIALRITGLPLKNMPPDLASALSEPLKRKTRNYVGSEWSILCTWIIFDILITMLLTLVLSYVFCVNPTAGWWFIEKVNMKPLVSATAPHLLSGERLRNNHTGPPGMSFHLGPYQSASTKHGWLFSGEKPLCLWYIFWPKCPNTFWGLC